VLIALNEKADLIRFGPGEVLFRAGDLLTELHFLCAGNIGTTCPHGRDEHALIDVMTPVRPICLPAVLLGLPAPIGARSLTGGRIVALQADRLREVVHADAQLAWSLSEQALREAHETVLELRDLKLRSSSQRLAAYLLGLIDDPTAKPARFVLPFEKRLLAAKVGCSQENLSRAFAALRRVGVETQRAIVVVRDVQVLSAFAGASTHRPSVPIHAGTIVKRLSSATQGCRNILHFAESSSCPFP
jgi:CRP/FNR family transcriptional activator FtrB